MEYDFTIVYKPCKIHVVVDVLSRLLNTRKHSRVLEQTTNVSLFTQNQNGWMMLECFYKQDRCKSLCQQGKSNG
jgi:hypothetical protein